MLGLKREFLFAKDYDGRMRYTAYAVTVVQQYSDIHLLTPDVLRARSSYSVANLSQLMISNDATPMDYSGLSKSLKYFDHWLETGEASQAEGHKILESLERSLNRVDPHFRWLVDQGLMDKQTGEGGPLILISLVNARDVVRYVQDVSERPPANVDLHKAYFRSVLGMNGTAVASQRMTQQRGYGT